MSDPLPTEPALAPLTRLQVQSGLRISIWEGVWATVWTVLTTGAFQIGFARYLGANDFALGVLAALPPIVGLLQLFASAYVEKRGERKRFVATAAISGRLLWLPILLIPFVLPHAIWLAAFLLLLALSSALLTIVMPAWTSWMSDLVPPDRRGTYFAQRTTIAGVVTLLVPLPAGAFLDLAVKYHRFEPRLGFAALFALSVAAALVSFFLLLRQPEPPMARRESGEKLGGSVAVALRDANFRRFLWFSALVAGGQMFAAQFFTAWQVDANALNLPYLTVQILATVASGASLLATPVAGYLADKYGSRPVLALSAFGTIVAPIIWLFTRPGADTLNIALIAVLNICAGASWAGFGLTQFNLLVGIAPGPRRATYVAVFSGATGIAGGVAPLIGGTLMATLHNVNLPLGIVTLNNYKILFLLTVLIRIVCLLLFAQVREAESRSARYVLGQLRQARPVQSLLTLRRVTRPVLEEARLEAVGTLGELRSPLVVEELTRALDDVSPSVREEAARALGEIRDSRAVPALVAKLADPAANIGELAADALGNIGSAQATEALLSVVRGPDARVRYAALRALTRIGDVNALPILVSVLDPAQPTTTETACSAIAAIATKLVPGEDADTAAVRLLALLNGSVPRGMRLAAARALAPLFTRAVWNEPAWNALTAALASEQDTAVAAQEALALSQLGYTLQRDAGATLSHLMPVLRLPNLSGIAFKQALEAVADVALGPGVFYPYLGQNETARDASLQRLLEEVRRHLREGDRPLLRTPLRPDRRLVRAKEASMGGDYARCVILLHHVARPVVRVQGKTEAAPMVALVALAHRAVACPAEVRPDEALLAAVLLRAIV